MFKLTLSFSLTAAVLAGAAHAAPDTVIRLTPEQIAAIHAEQDAAAKDDGVSEAGREQRVHGEVAVSIGTGGDREITGAINAPVGADGRAIISGGAGRWPRPPIVRNADRR